MARLLDDSLVNLESGQRARAATVLQGSRILVLRDHTRSGKLSWALVSGSHAGVLQETTRLVTASGRIIRVPFGASLATAVGWECASRLGEGARVAIARRLPEPLVPVVRPDHELILLGHLIGDGSFLRGQPMRYTTASEENSEAVTAAARAVGCDVKRYVGRRSWHQLLLSNNGNRWHPMAANALLRKLGIFGQRSHQKQIPDDFFELSNESLALFLRHLWATDGTFSPSGLDLNYFTNSTRLAADVLASLLRFGIVARCSIVKQGKYRPMNMVQVSGVENQLSYLDRIGWFGPKAKGAIGLRDALQGIRPNTNVDSVPAEFFDRVENLAASRSLPREQRNGLRQNPKRPGNRLFTSRKMLGRFGELLDDELTRARANSDIFWDRVVEVTRGEPAPTVELTLDPPGSGVLVDGILVGETPREYLTACPRTRGARPCGRDLPLRA